MSHGRRYNGMLVARDPGTFHRPAHVPRSARVSKASAHGFQIDLVPTDGTPWGFHLDPSALEEGALCSTWGGGYGGASHGVSSSFMLEHCLGGLVTGIAPSGSITTGAASHCGIAWMLVGPPPAARPCGGRTDHARLSAGRNLRCRSTGRPQLMVHSGDRVLAVNGAEDPQQIAKTLRAAARLRQKAVVLLEPGARNGDYATDKAFDEDEDAMFQVDLELERSDGDLDSAARVKGIEEGSPVVSWQRRLPAKIDTLAK
eukprot:Skav231493  [mRNA]  locus=scaffold354:12633:17370:- [translate_table: standard]